jgi:hypothetical protein
MMLYGLRLESLGVRVAGLLLAAGSCATIALGCTTSVSTLQSPRTVEPGHAELIGGVSVPIHGAYVTQFGKALDDAAHRVKTADSAPLSDAEERDVVDAALAGVLFTPTAVPELGLRLGVADRVDVGIRWAGPAFRGDGKVHLYRTENGLNLGLTAGYGYHTGIGSSIASSIYDVFDALKLVDYSRHDVDVALLVGGNENAVFSGYGALRGIVSFTKFESELPEELVGPEGVVQIDTSSSLFYLGGTAGMRLGPKTVAALAELTVMHCWFNPRVLGERRDLSGLVFSPALGLDVRF